MNPKNYFKRIQDIVRPKKLQGKKALIIGQGSGGSRVAVELGRLGVQLLLVERPGECLEEHNIIRHILGYASLGKLKLTEMAAYIQNLNPAVSIEIQPLDVTAEKDAFGRLVAQWRPELIVVCTDDEPSKYSVNEVAMRQGIPLVVAGVYDAGIGGEVIVVRPQSACYGCIAAQTQRPSDLATRGSAIDYNHLDLDGLRTTCALNLDIEQIALLHARVALNLLLDREPDLVGVPPKVNVFVFANRLAGATFARPLHCEFHVVDKRPDCLVCGDPLQEVEAQAERILASLQVPGGALSV